MLKKLKGQKMNRKRLLIGLALGLSLLTLNLLADDAKARAIMEKVDARNDGETVEEEMNMVLIDANGNERIRNLQQYSKDFGKDEHKIMFFISPQELKSTGFLTFDYKDATKDDDQWIYLPALKKTKRIPSADKSSNFMGSDFSYYDMTDRNLEDFDFKLLKETTIRGNEAWVIEEIPRTDKVIKESGYEKTIAIVRKDNYMVVRAINFMSNDIKKYMDITKLHQESGVWLSDQITMTTKQGKITLHKTILNFSNIKLNQSIDDSIFTTRRLEKGL